MFIYKKKTERGQTDILSQKIYNGDAVSVC